MAYLYCGRCGLDIKLRAAYLQVANCPRCLARSATVTPLTLSPRRVDTAVGWGVRAADHQGDPREPGGPFAYHGDVEAHDV